MVKTIKLLFITLLLFSMFSCKTDSDYEKGLKAFENYKYEEAVQYFEHSLIKEDDETDKEDKYLMLSKTYLNLGEYLKATEILDKSIDETDGQKTYEFMGELLNGYDLINEDGINHKTVKINLHEGQHVRKNRSLRGNLYYMYNTWPAFYMQSLWGHYPNVMILEIDNINNNHKYLTVDSDTGKLTDSTYGIYENIKVSLNYKDGELDTFTLTGENISDDEIWIFTRVYGSNFKILTYTFETYYPILDTDKHDILEAEFYYHDNDNLEKYCFRIRDFLTIDEKLGIQEYYLDGIEIPFDIYDLKNRQDYVRDEVGIFTYADDERFLKEERYEFDILEYDKVAEYDENNRVISYICTTYNGFKATFVPPTEWRYEYNEDGYLTKETCVKRDVFHEDGYYATYEYNDDYTKYVITEHSTNGEENSYEYSLLPDGTVVY